MAQRAISRLVTEGTVQASQMKWEKQAASLGSDKPPALGKRVVKGSPIRTHPSWYRVKQGRAVKDPIWNPVSQNLHVNRDPKSLRGCRQPTHKCRMLTMEVPVGGRGSRVQPRRAQVTHMRWNVEQDDRNG